MDKGLGALIEGGKSSGGKDYLKLADGEQAQVRFIQELTDVFSGYFHRIETAPFNVPCRLPERCPLCEKGDKRTFIFYISFIDRKDEQVKLMQKGKTVSNQLVALLKAYGTVDAEGTISGTITDRDFVISRSGSKMNDTAYTIIPLDKSALTTAEKKLEPVDVTLLVTEPDIAVYEDLARGNGTE